MCGIAGIITYGDRGPIDQSQLVKLRDAQRHRGPDDSGLWVSPDGRLGFGHRRLSIVDLSAQGHQPMSTQDGQVWIVFNGEIYNFHELRRQLEALGHRFASTSDTEVVLLGYRQWGLDLLTRMRGMYA